MAVWVADRWRELPTWAKWAVGISAILLIDSFRLAWGERRFVAALAESFVANALYWGLILGGLAGAIWLGMYVAGRSSKHWLGWVAGVGAYVGAVFVLLPAFSGIPGIGWRFNLIMNSDCYVDWDGRSNPTVCE